MMDLFKGLFAEGSKGWLVVIVIILMVGPTGIEKAFDRVFPPAAEELADNTQSLPYQLAKQSLTTSMMVAKLDEIAETLRRLEQSQQRAVWSGAAR